MKKVTDESFKKYGKVISNLDFSDLSEKMNATQVPEDVIYVPSMECLEKSDVAQKLKNSIYGGLDIQIGYCNGHNKSLNALEYHRCSEVDVAVDNLILLLGCQQDIEDDFTYDTERVEAFYVPAGTAVELYATTLHYAPCNVEDQGFRCVIVLPKDTNTELTFETSGEGEEKLMVAKNKWLIAHEDAKIEGAFNGLKGLNITLE